jgi:hypothetical protein
MKILNLDELTYMAEDCFRSINPDDLAFLFASGKSEGFLRDQLGAYLSQKLETNNYEHVTREWNKHDLAIMDGKVPIVLIEGKSWICHDAFRKSKLLRDKKSIYQGSLYDVQKLIDTRNRFSNVSIFITSIIYGVDTSMEPNFTKFNVTYGYSHDKGVQGAGNFSTLVQVSRRHCLNVHKAFGSTKSFPLKTGTYNGMKVEADFFITEIRESPSKRLKHEIEALLA